MSLVLDRNFSGTAGASYTNSDDADYDNVAGTAPTYQTTANTGIMALRFATAAQSIIGETFSSTTTRTMSRIWKLSANPASNGEVIQVRSSGARGPGVIITTAGKLILTNVNGSTLTTSTNSVPTGTEFRITFKVNGTALSVAWFSDTSSTTPVETVTGTGSGSVNMVTVRDGHLTSTGLGTGVTLDMSWPRDESTTTDPGPRTYTTPVSGTSTSATWSVRSSVGTTSTDATWSVRAAVTDTSTGATWSVRTPVGSTSSANWSVRAAIGSTGSATWSVRAVVSSTSTGATWSTRAPVGSTGTASWSARAAITGTGTSATWETLAASTVGGSTSADWSVRAAVGGTGSASWSVRAAVTGSRSANWSVRSGVAGTGAANWGVRSFVAGSSSAGWAARAAVAGSTSATWEIRITVDGTTVATWQTDSAAPLVTLTFAGASWQAGPSVAATWATPPGVVADWAATPTVTASWR